MWIPIRQFWPWTSKNIFPKIMNGQMRKWLSHFVNISLFTLFISLSSCHSWSCDLDSPNPELSSCISGSMALIERFLVLLIPKRAAPAWTCALSSWHWCQSDMVHWSGLWLCWILALRVTSYVNMSKLLDLAVPQLPKRCKQREDNTIHLTGL